MDLRIVNTCNNDCLYCLESSLRNKEKFISKDFIVNKLLESKERKNITFYGGNPLLHPDLLDIISFCFKEGFGGIGLLSNGYSLDKNFLSELIKNGLNTFGLYFNSFDKKRHEAVNGGGITYDLYLKILDFLSSSGLSLKIIIHINNLNIDTIARDVLILRKKYNIKQFDFVNYFPFDKPYKNKDILEYSIPNKKKQIITLFKIIKKLNLEVNFVKFSKDFFYWFTNYYNFDKGVLNQIGEEDIKRLSGVEKPFCFEEKRCNNCFIKDNCKFYVI